MTTLSRIVIVSICLCPFADAALAAEGSGSPPTSNENAIKRLDAILVQIRDDIQEANSGETVSGVERSVAKDRPTEVTSVCISPQSWLGCGCCGAGAVKSRFSDSDMACVAAFDEITSLIINRSKITDAGLRHLAGLRYLENLDLSENAVTDDGLKYLASLKSLKSLNLCKTRFAGSGLTHLAKLRELRALKLDDTPITGNGLTSLPDMPLLEEITAAGTRIDGVGMEALRRTPNLRMLNLNNTLADDAGLSHLAGLTHLRTLLLDRARVSDAGLIHLRGAVELRVLSLNGNQVQGEGLLHLGGCSQIERLEVSCEGRYPKLTKGLAAVFSRMKRLAHLTVEAPAPATLPDSQRTVELYGMPSLKLLTIFCPEGAEAIDLRDLPKLDYLDISHSLTNRRARAQISGSPHARIGELRIQGPENLSRLAIDAPERLQLPDLKCVNWLILRGVLKAEALNDFRRVDLERELHIEALPGSEPSVLAIFADKFKSDHTANKSLTLSMDAIDLAWLEQLGKVSPPPSTVWLKAHSIDSDGLRHLAGMDGLARLHIGSIGKMKRLVLRRDDMPRSLENLYLDGFEAEELCFEGWCPDKEHLHFPGLRPIDRLIVTDIPHQKKLGFDYSNAIGEIEVRNMPRLETVHIPHSKAVKSLRFIGSFPVLRELYVQYTAIGDECLAQLAKIATLKTLNIVGCRNVSGEAVATFRKARPDVRVEDVPRIHPDMKQ